MNNYDTYKEAFDNYSKEYTSLIDLNAIFNNETYPINVPNDIKNDFTKMKNSIEEVKKLLEDIEGKMDGDRNRSKKDLKALMPALEQNLKELKAEVEEFDLNNEEHDPVDIQEILDKIVEKATELTVTSKEYEGFHERLEMPINDSSDFIDYERKMKTYQTYWRMKAEWG